MHHYGSKELAIGQVLTLHHEPNNAYDPNAVAIKEDGKTLGYLIRGDARVACRLFQENLVDSKFYLRAKYPAEVHRRSIGPQQRCCVGFKCKQENIDRVKEIMKWHSATTLIN